MHHKDNSVPRPFPGGRRMDLAQLAGFTSAFPCARRDAGCENRPETLLLPRESAPGPSLLCHGRGLRVTLPGVLSPARHTERSPPSWRPRPVARPGPPPPWAPRPRPPGSAASCNTCGRFLIASGRPASCGRGRAGPGQGRLWFWALDSPFGAPSLWALPSRSGLAPLAHAQIPPLCGSNWFRHPRGEELNAHIHREEDELRDVVTPRPQGARSGASVHRPQDGTGRVETWPEHQRPLWPPRPSAQAWPPGTHTPWGSRVLGRPPACRPLTCHAARLNALFLSFGVSQDQVARVTSL